jgi:hypothetical protein
MLGVLNFETFIRKKAKDSLVREFMLALILLIVDYGSDLVATALIAVSSPY